MTNNSLKNLQIFEFELFRRTTQFDKDGNNDLTGVLI